MTIFGYLYLQYSMLLYSTCVFLHIDVRLSSHLILANLMPFSPSPSHHHSYGCYVYICYCQRVGLWQPGINRILPRIFCSFCSKIKSSNHSLPETKKCWDAPPSLRLLICMGFNEGKKPGKLKVWVLIYFKSTFGKL